MSTSFYNVVTARTPSMDNDINVFDPPRSSHPVLLTQIGLPCFYSQALLAPVLTASVTTAAEVRTASRNQRLSGTYFDATLTLDTAVLTPYRIIINATPAAARTWTTPTAALWIAYLKLLLGPENVTGGLAWSTTITNSSTGDDADITVAGGTGVTLTGSRPVIRSRETATPGADTARDNRGVTFFILLGDVTPGAEEISVTVI